MATVKCSVSEEKYREYLVEAVKAAGNMLIDNAEDLVGNTKCISDLNITFDFGQELYDSIPRMTVTRSHMPSYEIIEDLMNKR